MSRRDGERLLLRRRRRARGRGAAGRSRPRARHLRLRLTRSPAAATRCLRAGGRSRSESASRAAPAPRRTAWASIRDPGTGSSPPRWVARDVSPESSGRRSTARAHTPSAGLVVASRCWPDDGAGRAAARRGRAVRRDRLAARRGRRKLHAGTALVGDGGEVLAVSRQLWIAARSAQSESLTRAGRPGRYERGVRPTSTPPSSS